ncbi:MAG: TonB-dependent receptor [Chitinophagia bacterium]|nr:TonB-dependent receptor [Chitinophagia bacterium]
MKKIYLVICLISVFQSLYSQKNNQQEIDTISKRIDLDEVVISSSGFAERKKNIAQKIEVISAKKIAQSNSQNTGDFLINTGKIYVQKSQQGGSSPVIRGFEASRILIVIDGVRLNNAIYRSGHLQNIITNDQNSLQQVELMYGPSSTIYGSDALGGTIHLITKSPILSSNNKTFSTGTAFTRYSSVNNEKTIHADASIGGRKFAWFQSYNFSDFGDMKMGKNYPNNYPNFGRRSQYIGQVNGIDSIMKNTDDRLQKFSGYKQWDIIQKFIFKQNEHVSHTLNLQLSNTNNVPRYDRLQDVKNFGGTIGNALRYAEWYYGPQKREMAAYELNISKISFWDELKMNINFQSIDESRQTREYRRLDRFDSQVEKVNVFGTTISGRKKIGNNEWVLGGDIQLNDVRSTASRTNLTTGAISKLNTRYPDGKNRMNNLGVYAQHTYKFKNQKLVLNDGLRIQSINLQSNVTDNSFFHLPDTAVKQSNIAITGNAGIVFVPNQSTLLSSTISSAFRAPNIDDLSKIFESSTSAKQVVIPNANLKPEYSYNVDLTIRQMISKKISFELTGFYTLFNQAIIKAPFKLNGQDSINYNGVKSQVLASQNVNRANLYGFSLSAIAEIFPGLTFNSSLSATKGFYRTDNLTSSSVYEKQANGTYSLVKRNVSSKPLDHIPPMMGKTSFNYMRQKFSTEVYFLYNGWKHLNQYNADGEDNAQYATVDGMPSWLTVNWKAAVNCNKNLLIQVGIENIFDRNYRYFASGFSAGGRNMIVALRLNW